MHAKSGEQKAPGQLDGMEHNKKRYRFRHRYVSDFREGEALGLTDLVGPLQQRVYAVPGDFVGFFEFGNIFPEFGHARLKPVHLAF